MGIWAFPLAPENDKQIDVKKAFDAHMELLTWYMDSFLPMAVGLEFWGPTICPFHLMTDKALVEGDPSGKEKVLVTVTSEAFGQLVYANCRDKWTHEFNYKKGKRKGTKCPKFDKDDKTTHVYQNKWSSSQTGQLIGGGWAADALNYFIEALAKLQKIRQEEEESGYQRFQIARTLIQAVNETKLDDDGNSDGFKKRKSPGKDTGNEDVQVVDLLFLDK